MVQIENINPSIRFANWIMNNHWTAVPFQGKWGRAQWKTSNNHTFLDQSFIIYSTTEELYLKYIKESQLLDKQSGKTK